MAETDLKKLLKSLKPKLHEGKYYFATIPESAVMSIAGYLQYIRCVVREEDGITIVFEEALKEIVDSITHKKIQGPFAQITLNVESDLLSVGLLAKVTEALAKEKIPANSFSGYFHDTLFVPYESKEKALAALERLQK